MVLLMMAILTGVRWNLSVVLICISFNNNFFKVFSMKQQKQPLATKYYLQIYKVRGERCSEIEELLMNSK
jgi:hypothetical protein